MTIWTIILAAGESRRFQGIKALAAWNGGTLLSQAIKTAKGVCGENVLIVTGGHAEEITAAASGILTVHNEHWQSGLGSSIAVGLCRVMDHANLAIIFPVDQPFVTEAHLNNLVSEAMAKKFCVLSSDGDIIGPPAAIPVAFFGQIEKLQGDKGLKSVLDHYAVVEAPGILRDIDTQDDLLHLKASLKTA